MSFINSKEERAIVKKSLLDVIIIEQIFNALRDGINTKRNEAKKMLEGETNTAFRLALSNHLSHLDGMDLIIHLIEAVSSNVADQNQTLYKLVKELTEIHKDNDELRQILQDHQNSINDYEKHKEILDWIDNYVKEARRDLSK